MLELLIKKSIMQSGKRFRQLTMNCFFLYCISLMEGKSKINAGKCRRLNGYSVEFVIENLEENEFEAIFVKDILSGIVAPADKKVGE